MQCGSEPHKDGVGQGGCVCLRGTASAKALKVWRGWRSDTTNCLGCLSGASMPSLLTPDLEASMVIIIIVMRCCVCVFVCIKKRLSLVCSPVSVY